MICKWLKSKQAPEPIERAVKEYVPDEVKPVLERIKANPDFGEVQYLIHVNLSINSSQPRFFMWDRSKKKMERHKTSHGVGKDAQGRAMYYKANTGICPGVSNKPGSYFSSKGLYRTAETYTSYKNGLSLRIDGLDETNSNARARLIVVHPGNYVRNSHKGPAGRSQGCIVLDPAVCERIINQIKFGKAAILVSFDD